MLVGALLENVCAAHTQYWKDVDLSLFVINQRKLKRFWAHMWIFILGNCRSWENRGLVGFLGRKRPAAVRCRIKKEEMSEERYVTSWLQKLSA